MTGEPSIAIARRTIGTPWVLLEAVAIGTGVVALHPAEDGDAWDSASAADAVSAHVHLDALEAQVEEYVAGARRSFDVPLDLTRVRGFRRDALKALREVPFGTTVSYAGLAELAGRPAAHRAAASACAHNPVLLLVPCHRVIHADGRLGGYGGRPWLKRALLAHEGVAVP